MGMMVRRWREWRDENTHHIDRQICYMAQQHTSVLQVLQLKPGSEEALRVLDKSSKGSAEALMYFFPINKTPWALKQA